MIEAEVVPAKSSLAPSSSAMTTSPEEPVSPNAKKLLKRKVTERLIKHRKNWLAGNLVSLSRKQAEFPRDLPGRGPYWISRQVVPQAPGSPNTSQTRDTKPQSSTLTDLVYDVCIALKTHPSQCVTVPRRKARSVPTPVEWIAWREAAKGDRKAREPVGMSEDDKFASLEVEWQGTGGPTVLHVHGGGF